MALSSDHEVRRCCVNIPSRAHGAAAMPRAREFLVCLTRIMYVRIVMFLFPQGDLHVGGGGGGTKIYDLRGGCPTPRQPWIIASVLEKNKYLTSSIQ